MTSGWTRLRSRWASAGAWAAVGAVVVSGAAVALRLPSPSPVRAESRAAGAAARADDDDEQPQFLPGLVAAYSDGTHKSVRVETDPSFALKAGESLDPRISGDAFSADYEGALRVFRKGQYRFTATVVGVVSVTVAGKTVVSAEGGPEPAAKTGEPVDLEPGLAPLSIKFKKAAGSPARLQLSWEGKGIRPEPLPPAALVHLKKQETPELAEGTLADRGRHLVEEFNCLACHKAEPGDKFAATLTPLSRKAPELKAQTYLKPGFIYHWLGDPQKFRPGTPMPVTIPDDEDGKTERLAVTLYLTANPKTYTRNNKGNAKAGEAHFKTIGCAVCHQAPSAQVPAHVPLKGLASKWDQPSLATFISNPTGIHPHTRMPGLLLQKNEADDLAAYLMGEKLPDYEKPLPAAPSAQALASAYKRVAGEADAAKFEKMPQQQQVAALGKAVLVARNCVACHTHKDGNKALAAPADLPKLAAVKAAEFDKKGCLTAAPVAGSRAPHFTVAEADRKAIAAFLGKASTGAGSPAPTFAAKATLAKLNCLSCHQRSGAGGLSPDLIDQLQKYEKAENAEAVMPPGITQIGYKVKQPWLQDVLTGTRRSRPWMALRMPQFNGEYVGKLAAGLAACDGLSGEEKDPAVPFDGEMVKVGRMLVGKSGFGCVACHDVAGRAAVGVRGPDLAKVTERVRDDWLARWMWDPQRLAPGTRMPTIHIDGKTSLKDVLDGDLDRQVSAMRQYMALAEKLPLPEGVTENKGIPLAVTDKTLVERCFMREAGAHSIAVGFPGGVSAAFDAYNCRMVVGWSGGFLDMKAMWDGRGGQPAVPIGGTFWSSPEGFPWSATASPGEAPDWDAQAKDKTLNDVAAAGERPDHPRKVHFHGYSMKPSPTFRYSFELPGGAGTAKVKERPEPLSAAGGVGLARNYEIEAPATSVLWLLAARGKEAPTPYDAEGNAAPAKIETGPAEIPVGGWLIVQQKEGPVLLRATGPGETKWVVRKTAAGYEVSLRPGGVGPVRLETWAPFRPEASVIAQLMKSAGEK